ncbi:MAG TPA: hypothetical protein V6D28_02940 [Leptolyngbyaceae cyanobacterium]
MLQLASMEFATPKLVRLDFNDLKQFEQVSDRYRHLGVGFSGAIALQPSNPAFPNKSGSFVLMPMGNLMSLSAYFYKPIGWAGALVCSSRIVVLAAYDKEGNFLGQTSTIGKSSNLEDREEESTSQQLQLNFPNIVKLEFYSCLPFTLDDFFFALLA